jgi:hypothetical protein
MLASKVVKIASEFYVAVKLITSTHEPHSYLEFSEDIFIQQWYASIDSRGAVRVVLATPLDPMSEYGVNCLYSAL